MARKQTKPVVVLTTRGSWHSPQLRLIRMPDRTPVVEIHDGKDALGDKIWQRMNLGPYYPQWKAIIDSLYSTQRRRRRTALKKTTE